VVRLSRCSPPGSGRSIQDQIEGVSCRFKNPGPDRQGVPPVTIGGVVGVRLEVRFSGTGARCLQGVISHVVVPPMPRRAVIAVRVVVVEFDCR